MNLILSLLPGAKDCMLTGRKEIYLEGEWRRASWCVGYCKYHYYCEDGHWEEHRDGDGHARTMMIMEKEKEKAKNNKED